MTADASFWPVADDHTGSWDGSRSSFCLDGNSQFADARARLATHFYWRRRGMDSDPVKKWVEAERELNSCPNYHDLSSLLIRILTIIHLLTIWQPWFQFTLILAGKVTPPEL